jgi:hypothetical protein
MEWVAELVKQAGNHMWSLEHVVCAMGGGAAVVVASAVGLNVVVVVVLPQG